MLDIPLLPVCKNPAKDRTFARELCNAKSPVKREVLSTVQNLGLLQLYVEGFRSDAPYPFRGLWVSNIGRTILI